MLAARTIHLYMLDLSATPAVALAAGQLTPEEQSRASRFARPEDRRRFEAARLALRQILSRYTQPVELLTTPHGKPYLEHGPHFNLSHTEDCGLLAVASDPVGVDVETHRPLPDLEELAAQIMTPRELCDFLSLPGAAREPAFYSLWTRKESLLKAVGTGLLTDPRTVYLGVGEGQATVSVQGRSWITAPLAAGLLPMGVSAAVSLAGTDTPTLVWRSASAD